MQRNIPRKMGAAVWQPGQVESKAGQALARLRPSAKKPIWNPSITGSWDYGEVCANASALYDGMDHGSLRYSWSPNQVSCPR